MPVRIVASLHLIPEMPGRIDVASLHLFFTGISGISDLPIPERGAELGACPVALPLNLYAAN
jgi:hypothetical protein